MDNIMMTDIIDRAEGYRADNMDRDMVDKEAASNSSVEEAAGVEEDFYPDSSAISEFGPDQTTGGKQNNPWTVWTTNSPSSAGLLPQSHGLFHARSTAARPLCPIYPGIPSLHRMPKDVHALAVIVLGQPIRQTSKYPNNILTSRFFVKRTLLPFS
jgi:hypothetical protein